MTQIQDSHIEALHSAFTGEIILPGDARYDEAGTIMIRKGSPAIILQPRTAEDTALAVRFAKDNSLLVSVRSGGHSNAGYSTNDGGLVLDLRQMNTVEVTDEAKRLVAIGGGATWIEVAAELQKHGLALSSGDTKTVGVGGLTVGGGIGWMVRKYGLAIDSLVSADIVTASGEVLHASETENSDLFWAVRGGGGNFGVVISFEFMAHPVGKVYAGMIMYDFAELGSVLRGWRDYMRTAPEELTTMAIAIPTSAAFGNMPPMAMVTLCYDGDNETEAMKVIEPLLHIGKVTSEDVQLKDYKDVLEEAHPPEDMKVIVNNGFLKELSDELIDAVTTYKDQIYQIRSVGGAMNRVAPDATAFAHRDSEGFVVMPTILPADASEADAHEGLAPWRAVAPLTNGAYINFFSEWTPKELSAAYPEATYRRLQQVKQKYDPQNLFNQNYNITPAE